MRFSLEITLGNAAMRKGEHVAEALVKAAVVVGGIGTLRVGHGGSIRDENGNTVGEWKTMKEET